MQNYRQIIGTLNFWIFLCLVASLPFTHAIIRPLWVIWLVSWALELRWIGKPQPIKPRLRQLAPVFALAVWVGWEVCSALWSADPAATWSTFGRHINLLAVLIICIFGVNEQYKTSAIIRTLIMSSVLSVGVYLLMHYWIDNVNAALYDEIKPYHELDWLHMKELTFWIKHRLYYATVLTLSLIGIVFLLPEHIRQHGRWQAITLSLIASLVLMAGIWWSSSRMSLVNIVVLAGLWVVVRTPGWKKLLTIGVFFLLALASAWMLVVHSPHSYIQPAENEIIAEETTTEGELTEETTAEESELSALFRKDLFAFHPEEEEPSSEPRIAIWHTVFESPSDYLACGIGAGCSKGYMTEKYKAHGWTRLAGRGYTPHNQYFTECIELGIVAAILFLMLWLLLPFCYQGRTRTFAIYTIAVLMLNMLTESFLDRIEGIFIVCFLLLLLNRLAREEDQ